MISHRLWRFFDQAASCDIPEVHRLAETVETWWPAIEAGLITGYSNARSEGYNRLGKHEGRNAFGFRNPETRNAAYAGACTRQHRRKTAIICHEMPG
ncbi:MAG: transposase [Tetrasphaera sp.]